MKHPRRNTGWILSLASALALCAPPLGAQSLTSGGVEGTVRSADGALLAGAGVLLTDVTAGSTRPIEMGANATFSVPFLPSGSYDLLVEHVGFAPRLVRGVVVRPGRRVEIDVTLAPAAPQDARVDTLYHAPGAGAGSRMGVGEWFSPFQVEGLPGERGEIGELARTTSLAGEGLEVQGLPARMTGVWIDGVPFTPARRPGPAADAAGGVAFPLQVLERAELVTTAADVEWSGFGGGYLSGYTRRGTRDFRVSGFGRWASGSLDETERFGPEAVDHTSQQGGILVSGPLDRDAASFVVGAEARRRETPLQYGLPFAAATATLADIARDSFGVALGGAQPLLTTEVFSGFARLDWRLTDAHALTVRGNLATVSAPREGLGAWPGRLGDGAEGTDLAIAATLSSTLGTGMGLEARVGVERSRREGIGEPFPAGAGVEVLPTTSLAVEGLVLGSGDGYYGGFEHTTFHASETLHLRADRHLFKLGAAVRLASHEGSYAPVGVGEFAFSGLDAFARGEGYFTRAEGTLPVASFTAPRYSAYAQDTWSVAPTFDLLLGVRVDVDVLPQGDVVLNEEWATLTGLDNTLIGERSGRVSPRVGFAWDPAPGWTVHGAAGLYSDVVDPAVLGEVLANDGDLRIRRGLGVFEWPSFPAGGTGTDAGQTLSLLAPEYGAPRTAQAGAGISRLVGSAATVSLSAAYRRTDLLPRRADLNLALAPTGTDQHGRPVYGTLAKQGALLFAEPGTNRRFNGFDQVFAINTDGWSEYLGATFAFEGRPARGVTAFGSYTYSRTQDNWVGARSGWADARLSPFPQGLDGGDWTEGRSDFDVPHRVALGGEVRLGGRIAPRVAAVYRFRSGYPFTPGFRVGVDANGDGSARNDPAFVDPSVPGLQEVLSAWDCLETGRFAERNACREDGVHALDARLAFDLLRVGGHSAALVVDGLNLLSSDAGEPDRALYLVDPGGALQRPADGVVVPLVANPDFGSPIARWATGRTLRLGFELSY